jgi:FlaA1/EpsC-like NDP-sugar epimerase
MSATTIIFAKPAGASHPLDAIPRPIPTPPLDAATARATIDSVAVRVGRVLSRRPTVPLAAGTLAICALSWITAFQLQYEGAVPASTSSFMIRALPVVVLLKGIVLWMSGVFRIVWAYVGIADLFVILRAVLLILAAGYGVGASLSPDRALPKTVCVLDAGLTFVGVSGLFVSLRTLREARRSKQRAGAPRERVLIAGAGDAGEILLRELQWKFSSTHEIVGFVDDGPEKQGARLRGVPVLGTIDELAELGIKRDVSQVLIAVPTAGGGLIRRITRAATDAKLRVQVLPGMGQLLGRSALLPQLRDVSIEDLLRRAAVEHEGEKVSEFIRGKTILVTGAAGSIGSQLCRQILGHEPARLVVVDWAETPLHELLIEIKAGTNEPLVVSEMGDVTDEVRVREIFAKHSPDLVFHAAALKHVPMCESHVREAIRVNVGGTRIVAQAALAAGAQRFVLISTDKAVNPSSVMGATKRVAEILLQKLEAQGGPTRFIAVRFGNVLGSNGSVIPLFRRQLADGGPLTVTHPDMRRYFMAIPEAVGLVLHAAVLGRGGDLFELDMGEPVRIVDLAEDLIRLSGLVPGRDVKIEFTGMRPGEKLFEELYFSAEKVHPTAHPRIFCLRAEKVPEKEGAVLLCLNHLTKFPRATDPVLAGLRDELVRMLGPALREGSFA